FRFHDGIFSAHISLKSLADRHRLYFSPHLNEKPARSEREFIYPQLLKKQFEEAEKYYLEAFVIHPDDYSINTMLGELYRDLEDYIKSEMYLRSAIKIDPMQHNAYQMLAYIKNCQGDLKEGYM
ncbi:MAG: hypothetical protein AAGI23_19985, partial [Bacteroidota bacterium]